MASIKILGDSYTITSSVPVSTINKLKKFYPDALALRNAQNGKIVFAICANTANSAAIGENGINFNSVNEAGFPYATFSIPAGIISPDEKKEYVMNEIGTTYTKLIDLENHINAEGTDRLTQLEADFNNSIEVVG